MILRTDNPAHGGAVFARHEERPVLVYYALPGELVEAEPRGRQGGVTFARADRVLEPGAGRVEARCPHFGSCGGCQWQHAEYPLQLEIKSRVVAEAWRKAGLRLPPETPVSGMDDPWRYRIRGEFEAVYEADGLHFGFHRLRSHAVLPVATCPIHDLRIERAMLAFGQAAREHRLSGLQNLLLTVEPDGSGLLWTARFRGQPGRRLPETLVSRVAELLPDLVLLDEAMTLEVLGLTFRVRNDTFVQTNHRQTGVLYQTALEMLAPAAADRVLDLYAGVGTIGLQAADRVQAITEVEENPRAVHLGRLAARINGIGNAVFLAGRVEDALRGVRAGEHTAALLDPPRAGCDPRALAELLRLQPGRIVYVSCEPATHARDLALLVQGGYRIRRAAIVDMFPQTYHIESVALLER